jgi:hypothetical protein
MDKNHPVVQFSDCKSLNERERWLESDFGKLVLQHRPRLNKLHEEGKLKMMLREPHWLSQLNEWLFAPHLISMFNRHIPLKSTVATYHLLEHQKLDFLINGYIVIPDLIPTEKVLEAKDFVDSNITSSSLRDISQGNPFLVQRNLQFANFQSEFTRMPTIVGLFYQTALVCIVSTLLYGSDDQGKVKGQAIIHEAQIAIRYPQSTSLRLRHENLGGKQWHIDGLGQRKHSPFTLLVGIALSDQLEEYAGNLCVFPGSHYSLQTWLQEFVANGYLPLTQRVHNDHPPHHHHHHHHLASIGNPHSGTDHFHSHPPHLPSHSPAHTNDPSINGPQAIELYDDKPLLDEPQQILLKAGDVVLLHQKLAHRGGPNYSTEIRKMIYFRVHHTNHHSHNDTELLNNIWLELEGMHDVV